MKILNKISVFLFFCLANNLVFAADQGLCPRPELSADRLVIEAQTKKNQLEYVDLSKSIKDISTDVVVKEFFATPESLYNFMKLVYVNIDQALDNYRVQKSLENDAISLIFKGGNVLRIVANGVLAQLPSSAKDILVEKYGPDFKRSDADFAIYINEQKLNGLAFKKVWADINNIVYKELNAIRKEFLANPAKYFDFLKLNPKEAQEKMLSYFTELTELPIFTDKENERWFQAKFIQMQLLNDRAKDQPDCPYTGELDYKFITEKGNIVGIPLSKKPSWITNTDNLTAEWPLGSNPNLFIKFGLIRSKIAFEYIYEQDNKLQSIPIGGELIDVSILHNGDYSLKGFVKNYANNVAEYTLISPSGNDEFILKAYSIDYLTDDLQSILFISNARPWNSGPKYAKRLNRLFFLTLTQSLATIGSGQEGKEYIEMVREKLLKPLQSLFPLNQNTAMLVDQINNEINELSRKWPSLTYAKNFWQAIIDLINTQLIKNPEEGDNEAFMELLKAIETNIDIASQINEIPDLKINIAPIYRVDIDKLF